jgi:hypothetical protein
MAPGHTFGPPPIAVAERKWDTVSDGPEEGAFLTHPGDSSVEQAARHGNGRLTDGGDAMISHVHASAAK